MSLHNHHSQPLIDPRKGDKRVAFAIVINLGLTLAQVVGGVLSGSLALIADALHNFSDAIALIIAFFARKIARRPANSNMTFGYGRAELVAALINYTTLIMVGLYLIFEASLRFIEPQNVEGWTVVIVAGIALVVDLLTAMLTYSMSKSSLNIRALFLHNLADALASVAVIVAGIVIIFYDWRLIDPLVTLMIATYILWQSFREIGVVIRILMMGSPPDIDTERLVNAVQAVKGVANIHHAHLWQVDEYTTSLDAHLLIEEGAWDQADEIKSAVRAMLADTFSIKNSTLELDRIMHPDDDPRLFGQG
ncbi:MAG: cation transporter [Rhodobacteraceae bacterium]|nr:cation transporter [Paracoccaceae bacterium]